MKDNLIRILAILLLLLCFGATAKIMSQNDSMVYTFSPFSDPHDPALGGDATMGILPPELAPQRLLTKIPAAETTDAQQVGFHTVNAVFCLRMQGECYHFFALCNLRPAFCNLRPEALARCACIFATDTKQSPKAE